MTRPIAWVVLIAVLCAGCGVRPSGVITGVPAPAGPTLGRPGGPTPPRQAVALYFLTGSTLTPVFRPTGQRLTPAQTLTLLQRGPNGDERAESLTSEVPTGLDPITVTTDAAGNVEVAVSADVATLSATAVDQIVCTVTDALSTIAPITVTGDAATRGPRICPVTG